MKNLAKVSILSGVFVVTLLIVSSGCSSMAPSPEGSSESSGLGYSRNPAGLNPPTSSDDNSLQWPSTLYRDAERKFNNETNPLKTSNLAGVSWVHIGEIEEDDIHFSNSGLKDEDGAQSLMVIDGKESNLKATLGDDESKYSVNINDRGTATIDRKEGISMECRMVARSKVAQLLCRETGSASGTRYLLFKQSTFLRRLSST